MFTYMDASLKNVCTASLGIMYTACHLRSEKQTTPFRLDFKLAPFKIFLFFPIG
jgi:hypothetical protein